MPLPNIDKFGPPFSPLTNTPYGEGLGGPYEPTNLFLLMTNADFYLMNGSYFLLMV